MDMTLMRLTQLAFGYWQAQPLFALCQLGVFDLLDDGPLAIDEIVSRLGLHPTTGEGLLNAGVALKLLIKDGDKLANTPMAERYLVEGSAESLSHWVRVMGRWTKPWADLTEVIRRGAPAESQAERLGEDTEYTDDFILGIHEYARIHSTDFADKVDLAGRQRLIDVGGGAGTFAVALCRKYPELRATVLDLESVLELTRKTIASCGLSDRIDTRVVDYRSDSFGDGADAVLLSNVLHQESPEVCASILKRSREAMTDGGLLIAQGHFLNDDGVSPTFATLHNLSAFTLWDGGRSHTLGEISDMLTTAAFVDISSVAPSGAAPYLITANKPWPG